VELVHCVRDAVSLGLNVLDADYEKLDVNVANSDSDNESEINATVSGKTPVMFEKKVSFQVVFMNYVCSGFLWRVCIVNCNSLLV